MKPQSHVLSWIKTMGSAEARDGTTTKVERHRTHLPPGFLHGTHEGAWLSIVRGHPLCQGKWCLELTDGWRFVPLVSDDVAEDAAKVFAITRARELVTEAA